MAGPIALVLAGGGARGAFEAGALSVILPELERRGQRPNLYVGTSVGALNSTLLASTHHLPAEEQVAQMVEVWSDLTMGDVIRPLIGRTGPVDLLRLIGQLIPGSGVRLEGLMDPTPLLGNLSNWIDWSRLRSNLGDGLVSALAVVTTSVRSGRTVVFYESAEPRRMHRSHAVAYVEASIDLAHVAASAAIPVVFPAVRIESPARARGWYFDGGTRLNAPIKPALDLAAERLVVIAVDSISGPVLERSAEDPDGLIPDDEPPDIGEGILHLLEGTLVDPLIEDMRMLGNINAFFTGEDAIGAGLYRGVRGKSPYRRTPYVFVGPAERGAVGRVAAEVFQRRYSGLRALRSPDMTMLRQAIGGATETHSELLSLLFFDPYFCRELIELGRTEALAWLDGEHDDEGPWQLGPLGVFTRPRQWTAG
jgi:NTE family protein